MCPFLFSFKASLTILGKVCRHDKVASFKTSALLGFFNAWTYKTGLSWRKNFCTDKKEREGRGIQFFSPVGTCAHLADLPIWFYKLLNYVIFLLKFNLQLLKVTWSAHAPHCGKCCFGSYISKCDHQQVTSLCIAISLPVKNKS